MCFYGLAYYCDCVAKDWPGHLIKRGGKAICNIPTMGHNKKCIRLQINYLFLFVFLKIIIWSYFTYNLEI
jgi:hypothetical protein